MRRFIARRSSPGNQYLKRSKKALSAILAATFMAMVFTFVTASTIAITSKQAFAVKKEDKKVGKKKPKKFERKVWPQAGNRLFTNCLSQSDFQQRTSSSGAHTRCCSQQAGYCITCPTGKQVRSCVKRDTRKYRQGKKGRNPHDHRN
jgi:hypothetical protein